MRASDLLGSTVVGADGAVLGPLRDVRIDPEPRDGQVVVRWLVIGGREWAHRAGYFDGRTKGPWLLDRLLRGRSDSAVAVQATSVADWGPGRVVLSVGSEAVIPIAEAAAQW